MTGTTPSTTMPTATTRHRRPSGARSRSRARAPPRRCTAPPSCGDQALADVEAIQGSLAAVRQRPVELAEVFYDQLFAMVPAGGAMFPPDLTAQMQRMTTTLLTAIATLGDAYADGHDGQLAALERSLRQLGAAHATTGECRAGTASLHPARADPRRARRRGLGLVGCAELELDRADHVGQRAHARRRRRPRPGGRERSSRRDGRAGRTPIRTR